MKSLRYCVIGLSLLLAGPALAADAAKPAAAASPPQQAAGTAQPLYDELAEVVVRGKHLKEEIIKAEDEFYSIFNDVNKDDRYDVHCVAVQLDVHSQIQNRVCIPGFVADAIADWAPFKALCQPPTEPEQDEFDCLDHNRNLRISREEASARYDLDVDFPSLDADQSSDLDRQEFPFNRPIPNIYQPPPPDLVLMDGSKKWYDHMMEVTNSDPRLKKMADHLGDLYYQMATEKKRFKTLDAEVIAKKKKDMSGSGPRSH